MTDTLEHVIQAIGGRNYNIPVVRAASIAFETNVENGKTILVAGPELIRKASETDDTKMQRLYILLKPMTIPPEN